MKKLWLGLLAFGFVLSSTAFAASNAQLEERLSDLEEQVESLATDSASRLDISGDFRFRADSTRAHVVRFYQYNPFDGTVYGSLGGAMSPITTPGTGPLNYGKVRNDSLFTNRLRLNLKAHATENITLKARFTMYKIWGEESSAVTAGPVFGMNAFTYDPNISRRPNDNTLRVEMAYANWTNIFGLPMWVSVGRRPTVDGPPMQLKYNYDRRYATPVALGVDWTFDGATLGYAYSAPWPGKVRFCYGRGTEAGFTGLDTFGASNNFNDALLYGLSWDVINDPDAEMFANIQAFRAEDLPSYVSYTVVDPSNGYILYANPSFDSSGMGYQVGNIYHVSGVFMHNLMGIDYFVSGGLSRTDNHLPSHAPQPGFLSVPGNNQDHWGWAVFVGLRIPVEALNSKLGLEYNHGSKYWINFTPAADDLYLSKTATRGDVAEVYWIWDIPDTPLSKYGKAFVRLGYQYYWIKYTGSGSWMGLPVDTDSPNLQNPLYAQMFAPVDRMDNAYFTFEVNF
ncbi:DUF3373 domain-containing protein [Dissulfurirhabdus thermomarina]|uniref:DUF3373 domain-containing protein n=1 Tax=Dissulfurirhabdus thermomarina TaxID=1765737 RepID=A0A6N9TRE9_DISTH|nr:DUF3373 family protein [Dissulfurirhabdus thermomarina]NDY42324.1 DUF3373 domain-containing protein [Dissulfurirhabdus thermomarina]NMX23391.1 DUF3373 domain-containing protein [Dissulfurirhabdus thermomarina]